MCLSLSFRRCSSCIVCSVFPWILTQWNILLFLGSGQIPHQELVSLNPLQCPQHQHWFSGRRFGLLTSFPSQGFVSISPSYLISFFSLWSHCGNHICLAGLFLPDSVYVSLSFSASCFQQLVFWFGWANALCFLHLRPHTSKCLHGPHPHWELSVCVSVHSSLWVSRLIICTCMSPCVHIHSRAFYSLIWLMPQFGWFSQLQTGSIPGL